MKTPKNLLFIITTILTLISCTKQSAVENETSDDSRAIRNGREAGPNEFKSVLKIERTFIEVYLDEDGNEAVTLTKQTCSGAAIGKNLVLTAAHCLFGQANVLITPNINEFRVINLAGEEYEVVDFRVNYDFSGVQKESLASAAVKYRWGSSDLAILKVNSDLKENGMDIIPSQICEPSNPNDNCVDPGNVLEAVGFSGASQDQDEKKRIGKIKVSSFLALLNANATLKHANGSIGVVPADQENQIPCHGDSGGPAFFGGKIVGIAQYVFSNTTSAEQSVQCEFAKTATYVSIARHSKWIKDNSDELNKPKLTAWQNVGIPYDVNNDGRVNVTDVEVVINFLNRISRDDSPNASDLSNRHHTEGEPFVNVNGDKFISPLDVLVVINAIRRVPSYYADYVAATNLENDQTGEISSKVKYENTTHSPVNAKNAFTKMEAEKGSSWQKVNIYNKVKKQWQELFRALKRTQSGENFVSYLKEVRAGEHNVFLAWPTSYDNAKKAKVTILLDGNPIHTAEIDQTMPPAYDTKKKKSGFIATVTVPNENNIERKGFRQLEVKLSDKDGIVGKGLKGQYLMTPEVQVMEVK